MDDNVIQFPHFEEEICSCNRCGTEFEDENPSLIEFQVPVQDVEEKQYLMEYNLCMKCLSELTKDFKIKVNLVEW